MDMKKTITRRDLLNGIAIGAGTGLLSPGLLLGKEELAEMSRLGFEVPTDYYPPALTGMRGSHPGSFEVAHALAWEGRKPAKYLDTGEAYDLVVVGAGMSGLAAARFYQQIMGEDARILILDNHDDFGGHAKRNEFHHNGRMVLSLGGAQNIENIGSYSDVARGLMDDLGIETKVMDASMVGEHGGSNPQADNAISIPGPTGHVTLNGNWIMAIHGKGNYQEMVRALPLPKGEQDKLIELFGGEVDYLDDLSLSEKYDYAKTTSYNRFLVDSVGLDKKTLPLLDGILKIYRGIGGWKLTLLDAFAAGAPGLQGMGWLAGMLDSLAIRFADKLLNIQQFPDGNGSVARLLVHKLIPAVSPECKGFENIVVSRFDYAELDRPDHPVRLRLNSTAVAAKQVGDKQVQVDYVQKGQPLSVKASHCVLACYNGIIPHLCPELPAEQKAALKYGVKVPFVYANVLLDNGQAFSKLGTTLVQTPMDPFQMVMSAPTSAVGGFEPPRGPQDPMAILMMSSPTPDPGGAETARDLFRVGRSRIYGTPFSTYENQIRDQLQAILGPHGFDHERDIKAITVNRIPHGYAYIYNPLDDPEWPEGQAPNERGRRQFGRISIANSDSEATSTMDAAFDAAWRAVLEQVVVG